MQRLSINKTGHNGTIVVNTPLDYEEEKQVLVEVSAHNMNDTSKYARFVMTSNIHCNYLFIIGFHFSICQTDFFSHNTVKPVIKSHSRERQIMVFINKWPLFGCYFVLFYQGRVIECGLYLQGCLYTVVAFNTGLTVQVCLY